MACERLVHLRSMPTSCRTTDARKAHLCVNLVLMRLSLLYWLESDKSMCWFGGKGHAQTTCGSLLVAVPQHKNTLKIWSNHFIGVRKSDYKSDYREGLEWSGLPNTSDNACVAISRRSDDVKKTQNTQLIDPFHACTQQAQREDRRDGGDVIIDQANESGGCARLMKIHHKPEKQRVPR